MTVRIAAGRSPSWLSGTGELLGGEHDRGTNRPKYERQDDHHDDMAGRVPPTFTIYFVG